MRAKKIVNQSSDFPVRRTGSYRHKKSTDVQVYEEPAAAPAAGPAWSGDSRWPRPLLSARAQPIPRLSASLLPAQDVLQEGIEPSRHPSLPHCFTLARLAPTCSQIRPTYSLPASVTDYDSDRLLLLIFYRPHWWVSVVYVRTPFSLLSHWTK